MGVGAGDKAGDGAGDRAGDGAGDTGGGAFKAGWSGGGGLRAMVSISVRSTSSRSSNKVGWVGRSGIVPKLKIAKALPNDLTKELET
jgi:hypothetical protein